MSTEGEMACGHCGGARKFPVALLDGGTDVPCPWCAVPDYGEASQRVYDAIDELSGVGTGHTSDAVELLDSILSTAGDDGRLDHAVVVAAVTANPLGAATLIMNWMASEGQSRPLTEIGFSVPGWLSPNGRALRAALETLRRWRMERDGGGGGSLAACPHCAAGEFTMGRMPDGSFVMHERPVPCPWCTDDGRAYVQRVAEIQAQAFAGLGGEVQWLVGTVK